MSGCEVGGHGREELIQAFRKGAPGANGVRLEAVVTDDLEEALLHGRSFLNGKVVGAKDACPRQFQGGVVFAWGPAKVLLFDATTRRSVMDGIGTSPEPREDDIDGQFIEASGAEERDGFVQGACGQCVVTAPEAIGIGAHGFHKSTFRILGSRAAIDELFEPFGDPTFPIFVGDPGGGEGEPALGMVDGTDAVETPDERWKGDGTECVAFPPPKVPKDAGARAAFRFRREEPGEAEEAGFPCIARVASVGGERFQGGKNLRQTLHGPGIVLVPKCSEDAFAEGLSPASGLSAGAENMGLRAKSDEGGLLEEVTNPFGRK